MSARQPPRYGVSISNIWDEYAFDDEFLGPFLTFDAAWDAAKVTLSDGTFPHDETMAGYEVRVFAIGADENFAEFTRTDVNNRDSEMVFEVATKLVELEKPATPPTFDEDELDDDDEEDITDA